MFDIFKNLGHFFPPDSPFFSTMLLAFRAPIMAKYASLPFRRFFVCLVWLVFMFVKMEFSSTNFYQG